MRRVAVLAVWIGTWSAGSAAAAPTPVATLIAPLHGRTTIAAYGDIQVWSDYDAAEKSWHLVVRRDGQISTPAIAPSTRTIEADVGPGPSGSPLLLYTVCPRRCHLVASALDGSHPLAIPASNGASHPTIWGDRVAWVRGAAKVMTSRLDGSGRRVLAGTPRRSCHPDLDSPGPRRTICETTTRRQVDGLELHYGRLALTDQFETANAAGNGDVGEVRTEAVTGGPQRLIAMEAAEEGEGETIWLGPSWSEGKLFFYQDGAECVETCPRVYGFDPARRAYVRAQASSDLTGFSMGTGGRAYEATGDGEETGVPSPRACANASKEAARKENESREEAQPGGLPIVEASFPNTPCLVRLSAPIAFRPSRPPIGVP
jgi:hypothetical protein